MSDLAIETSGLTRRYGQVVAVEGLDLHVPRACVYGFLGPNGAGKSTTIRMLLGLTRPNAGRVKLFDRALSEDRRTLLGHVGSLVETPSLYPHLTGTENLEVTRRLLGAPRERVGRALKIVNLEADAHRLVRGYSLGMRQRLGLALALLNEPELLILDEPTNGLDPAGIRDMRALIRRLSVEHRMTIFLSSHLLSEVEQVATHLGIINRGRMVFEGTVSELEARRRERLRLGVNRPEEARRLLISSGWAVEDAPDGFLTVATQDRAQAAAINGVLVRGGLEVFHLQIEQQSLEDRFLQLTGEEMSEEVLA
jgi:ABC-type multidrug transport system ATPase subunit